MLLLLLTHRLWVQVLPNERSSGIPGFITSSLRAFAMLDAGTLLNLIALSVLFQAADIIACFLLAEALSIQLDLATLFVVMPVTYLITLLPISLGGLGIREGVLVLLLGRVGISVSDAVTFAFLIHFNRMLVGGSGGLWHLAETGIQHGHQKR
ncbi:hypothetical protein Thiowin_02747 [Thiorhodovibrio winogradskyi]|uniref:Flippase-like domain-containing protein n=1 Tax=Thiorhodovibrio winogradskyi TaxID=77007 RepID=A0ABZ0S9I4_9GAMM|nr:lysylphosphatidylglycerol synthase transmembrane domain-containing protein [Thiorhodovibrio winogradskyi]